MTVKRGTFPTKEKFAGQVHKTFRTSTSENPGFEVSMVEFKDIADTETVETFSLLFRAPADVAALQGTYRLENDDIGPLDIFLVPIRKDDSGLFFEAVFNRLKEKGAAA
jgi:hypothetical protein